MGLAQKAIKKRGLGRIIEDIATLITVDKIGDFALITYAPIERFGHPGEMHLVNWTPDATPKNLARMMILSSLKRGI